MASSIDARIWGTEREAAYAAHNMAERDAENSREFSAREADEG